MSHREPIDEKLESLGKAIGSEEKFVENVMSRIGKKPAIKSLQSEPQFIWGKLMKNPVRKLAAAAIIIVALLINFQSGNSGVAWGAVLEQVEKAQNIVFRITTNAKIQGEQQETTVQPEIIFYKSSEYGSLSKCFNESKLLITNCWNIKEPSMTLLFHESKKFRKVTYDRPGKIKLDENDDPCVWVKEIMKRNYTKLGKDVINSKKVEGIECSDLGEEVFGKSFKKATARLWVEIGTNYPVRIEIDGIDMAQQFDMPDNVDVNLSDMEMNMVMDDFQWNVKLDPNLFYPDIPSDYTDMDSSLNMNPPEIN